MLQYLYNWTGEKEMVEANRHNIERFTGFGALYDQNRPSAPK